jgi:hypothetical protein
MTDVLRCVADGAQNRTFYSRLTPLGTNTLRTRREEHVSL